MRILKPFNFLTTTWSFCIISSAFQVFEEIGFEQIGGLEIHRQNWNQFPASETAVFFRAFVICRLLDELTIYFVDELFFLAQCFQQEVDAASVFLTFANRIVAHKAHDFFCVCVWFKWGKYFSIYWFTIRLPVKQFTAKVDKSRLLSFNSDEVIGDFVNFTIWAYSAHVHSW